MLGQMPAMLRDILEETFDRQDDVVLVGTRESVSSLRTAVDLHGPDVVVVAVDGEDWAGGFIELFRDHPSLRLLAIRNDARRAVMHELSIRRWRVTDLSPAAILAAVRASAADSEAEADALFIRERP